MVTATVTDTHTHILTPLMGRRENRNQGLVQANTMKEKRKRWRKRRRRKKRKIQLIRREYDDAAHVSVDGTQASNEGK